MTSDYTSAAETCHTACRQKS